MEHFIRILILEDTPTDAELAEREILRELENCTIKKVERREEFIDALDDFQPDLVVADYQLPAFDGLAALKIVRDKDPILPFIMYTGSINEDTAVRCMKAGATDYVIKEHTKRLGPAARRALEIGALQNKAARAQQALVESEARFRELAENASDLIFRYELDPERKYAYVSPSSSSITGYTPEEYYTDPLLGEKTLHPDDRSNFESVLEGNNEPEQPLILRVTRKDGETIWLEQKGVYIYDHNRKIVAVEGIARDITARIQNEKELKQALEKAEQSDRLKTAFLNNLSHEIRTPLNAIVGFSDMLRESGNSREQIRYCTDVIRQSSDQLIHVVEDIINISTIETGQLEIFESEFDLGQLMERSGTRLRIKAEMKGLEFRHSIDLEEHDRMVISDETKLEHILTHLIDNAIKFTDQGVVEFGCRPDNGSLLFFITDTGIGIDPAMHEEIFKRFHQAATEMSQKRGGLGLGLPVSRSFIESLGGQIWLESGAGTGTTVYFSIPWKPAGKSRSDYERIAKKTKRKLLVAEDEESNYLLLKEMLGDFRTRVLHAVNGIQAIEMVEKNPDIDLVIMDIKMPLMGGYEATRRIKHSKPYLPVIALTAHALPGDREKAIEAGCDDYLSKPFMREDLKKTINKYLA